MSALIVRIDREAAIVEFFDVEDPHVEAAAPHLYRAGVTNRFEGESLEEVLGRIGKLLDEERNHVCISDADAGHKGLRMTELWALSAVDPADDVEGVIELPLGIAMKYSVTPGAAIANDQHRLHHLRQVAASAAGQFHEVRVRHFVLADTEDFPPRPTITNDVKL